MEQLSKLVARNIAWCGGSSAAMSAAVHSLNAARVLLDEPRSLSVSHVRNELAVTRGELDRDMVLQAADRFMR